MTIRGPTAVLATFVVSSVLAASLACGRKDRATPEKLRADIAALETERETLRGRLNELIVNDPRLEGMPETPVRVGVPTTLARDLIERVVAGFVDQVTLELKWDGKNVSGAVCGDMEITQQVEGDVRPDRYPVAGGLVLTATAKEILAEPRFPVVKVNLKVNPSEKSWGAVQKILDDKEGVCGFVLDKVDILGLVKKIIDKGFNVRLPTEKIKPMAVPVGIEPTMEIRGQPVALGIKVGKLAITEHVIWLGADVSVAIGEGAVAKRAPQKAAIGRKPPAS